MFNFRRSQKSDSRFSNLCNLAVFVLIFDAGLIEDWSDGSAEVRKGKPVLVSELADSLCRMVLTWIVSNSISVSSRVHNSKGVQLQYGFYLPSGQDDITNQL